VLGGDTRVRCVILAAGSASVLLRRAALNVLVIDDFALTPLDDTATTDFYELTVARHRKNATIVTLPPTNGSPSCMACSWPSPPPPSSSSWS
jgi:hypothetical protein